MVELAVSEEKNGIEMSTDEYKARKCEKESASVWFGVFWIGVAILPSQSVGCWIRICLIK